MTDVLRLHAARSRGSLPMRADAENNTGKAGSSSLRRKGSRAALGRLQPNALYENEEATLINQAKMGYLPRNKNFRRVPSRTDRHWEASLAESQEEGIVKPDATGFKKSYAAPAKSEVAVASPNNTTTGRNITAAAPNAATAKPLAVKAKPNNNAKPILTLGPKAFFTRDITTALATTAITSPLDEPSPAAQETSPPPSVPSIGATAFVQTNPGLAATATTVLVAPIDSRRSKPRPIPLVSTAPIISATPSLYYPSPTSTTHSIPLQTPTESYRAAYIHLARGSCKDDDETALPTPYELHEMVELHLPVREEKNDMSPERAQEDALKELSAKATKGDILAESGLATATPEAITAATKTTEAPDATNTPTACSTSATSTSTPTSVIPFDDVRAAVCNALGELRGVERVDLLTGAAEEQAEWVRDVLSTAGCSTAVTLTEQAGLLPLRLRGSEVKLWIAARASAPATSTHAGHPEWEVVRSFVCLPDADCEVLNGLQLNTWAKKHALLALTQPYGLLNDPDVAAAVALARLPPNIPGNAAADDVPLLALKRLSPAQYAVVNASDAASAAWYREIKRLWQVDCDAAACATKSKAAEGASE